MLRDIRRFKRNHDNTHCNRKENANATLKVGAIVKDKIPSEEIKLIVVPLKQSHLSFNLSDTSFETMGDQVSDTMDISQEKVLTGEEAAKKLKELHHKNISKESYG